MFYHRFLLSLVLVLCVSAQAVASNRLPYITSADVQAATEMVADGPASGTIPGLTVGWEPTGGDLSVVIANSSPKVVEVDWNRCAFVNTAGVSVGIVPGSTLKRDVKAAIPPSIIPPGSRLEEALVREDSVNLSDPEHVERLLANAVEGQTTKVVLALSVGGPPVYIIQSFKITVDRGALQTLNHAKEVEANKAIQEKRSSMIASWNAETYRLDAERDRYQRARNLWTIGGIAGAAALGGGLWADNEEGAAVFWVCASLGTGFIMRAVKASKMREIDTQLKHRPREPPGLPEMPAPAAP